MNKSAVLLALIALAVSPLHAGVSISVHVGGGFGGYGGYQGYSGSSCYGGHGYYGGGSCGYHGYYGGYGGAYSAYPYSYGYSSYGYAPVDDSYPVSNAPATYTTSDAPVYPYAPPATPAVTPVPTTSTTTTTTTTTTPTAPGPAAGTLATGKLDELGFVHSPFSTTTFKADKVFAGQVFYDPITGQPFTVAKPESPSAPALPPTTSLPTGKLDEFGYVHSPFSTFTFKVQNGNYVQVFRDPFTGQSFTAARKQGPPAVAGVAGTAQASD